MPYKTSSVSLKLNLLRANGRCQRTPAARIAENQNEAMPGTPSLALAMHFKRASFAAANSSEPKGLSFQSMNFCWRSMKNRRVSVFSGNSKSPSSTFSSTSNMIFWRSTGVEESASENAFCWRYTASRNSDLR